MMMKKLWMVWYAVLMASVVCAQQSVLNIVPYPRHVVTDGEVATLPLQLTIYVDPSAGMDIDYVRDIIGEIGVTTILVNKRRQADMSFLINKKRENKSREAYRLQVVEKGTITAEAYDRLGLLAALQTVRQLMKPSGPGISAPICTIEDEPFFPWRAFMLDESRHFHGKETVKHLLDEMARLKLNTFHWHLVDDPGWRIEIKRYPRLTDVGAKGNYTMIVQGGDFYGWDTTYPGKQGWFYTQDDIKEIVRYADDRGILIIPEIEVPAHASASIFAYPWLGSSSKAAGKPVYGDLYDVTDPKVEEFLHHVLDEIVALFPSKIIHIGGDEANYAHWQQTPAISDFMKANDLPTHSDLQVWAINRMSRYIAGKGYRMIGWNEITGDNIRGEHHIQASETERLAEGTIVQFWDGDISLINKAIEKGHDVVNSNRLYTYLDYSYDAIPLEKAYAFSPIPEDLDKADHGKILGLGCQMWGEQTPTVERVYYQTFPRIAAYALNGWVDPQHKPDYNIFLSQLKPLIKIWREKGYITDQPLE